MGNRHKLPNAFSPEQLVHLFDCIDNVKVGVASALAFFCGLRISEVCNLRISDVDFVQKELKIIDSKYTRRKITNYGKDRFVPLPDQLISPLRKWIALIRGGTWLFPSDKSPDDALRKKSLYEQYRVFLNKAGLDIPIQDIEYTCRVNGKKFKRKVTRRKYKFHTLRHSYGTYLRNKGVALEDIKELLGHERYDTTLVYARMATGQKRKAITEAFNVPIRHNVIPQEEVRRMTLPTPSDNPIKALQMQLIRREISKEEYQEMMQLLQPMEIKRLV